MPFSGVTGVDLEIFSNKTKAKMKNLLPRDDRKCNEEHFEKKFDFLRYFLSLKRTFSWGKFCFCSTKFGFRDL